MRRSIAGISIQLYKQKKLALLMIGILLGGFATLAVAQGFDLDAVSDEDAEKIMQVVRTYAYPRWVLTFAAMCIAPWLLALFGVRGMFGSAALVGKGPQMADHLRKVRILGSKYDLDVYTGHVMSEKSWTETTTEVDVTTTVGGNWTPGMSDWQSPTPTSTTTSVRTTSVRKDQIRLRYPDKTRGSWVFSNSNFIVEPGDIASLVARPVGKQLECLFAYNHDSSQFISFDFQHAHAISGKASWLLSTVLGVLGLSWGWNATLEVVARDVAPALGIPVVPMDTSMWIAAFVISAIVALVPLLVISMVLPRVRTMIFKGSVQPGIKHFLEVATSDARRSFPVEWEGRVAPASP